MILEEFLGRLNGVRGMGQGKHAAKCPGHEDRQQSLVVTDGGDRLLIACHAGCQARDITAAMGLGLRDLFYDDLVRDEDGVVNIGRVAPKAVPPAGQGGTGQAVLRRPKNNPMMPGEHYIDAWVKALTPELQARLFELKGWSAKTLASFRIGWDTARLVIPVYGPDGLVWAIVRYLPGGSPKTLAVGARELWPCPESFADGTDLWLVEGEPDAISARELGLDAVAVPGIGKWSDGWAERFRGRRVTIAFDCDEACCSAARAREASTVIEGTSECGACGKPRRSYGGREHALVVAGRLSAAGVDSRVVDLFPGATGGEDLGDLLVVAVREGRVPDLCRYLLRLGSEAWARAAA